MNNLTPAQLEKRIRLRDDFEYYAPRILKIIPPEGGIVPFNLTEQQKYLHSVAERQLREKGRVRIIVAKGRKTKTSTYVQGRFYWKVTHRKNTKAFVVAHEEKTTNELFAMTTRFHRNCPNHPSLKPPTKKLSTSEIEFAGIGSSYSTGTAGNKGVGLGFTPHYLHLSEVSRFLNGEEIARGLMTAVSDSPGTEIWIESTGNGPGDYFHKQAMEAIAGRSDFELVFLKWWLEPQYHSDEPITLTDDERKMLKQYPDLRIGNLTWRRKRIAMYGGGSDAERLFRREFPMNIQDVFSDTEGTFISPDLVNAAVSRSSGPPGPLVVGVDPGAGGEDPTAVVARKGGNMVGKWVFNEADPDALTGKVLVILRELQPKATFVDSIGVGYHLVGRLSEHIPGVRGVDFRKTADERSRYYNKRAEAYGNLKEWLATGSIPDDDQLKVELSVFKYKHRPNGQLILESKEDAKARGFASPNVSDALSLTLCEAVEDGLFDDDLWNIWPHKRVKDKPKSEMLPDFNYITSYAWLTDEKWAIAIVGVFIPMGDKMKMSGQKIEKANAFILRVMDGEGVHGFMDAATKLHAIYEPDYFHIPSRATIVVRDLRIKDLHIQKAKFDTVPDVVAVGHDVLKTKCAWIRNSMNGRKLAARLSRYPYGDDDALYGCIGLALAHLRQRGNIAVQMTEDEEDEPRSARRRRGNRRTAY